MQGAKPGAFHKQIRCYDEWGQSDGSLTESIWNYVIQPIEHLIHNYILSKQSVGYLTVGYLTPGLVVFDVYIIGVRNNK